jgi:predicted esterase
VRGTWGSAPWPNAQSSALSLGVQVIQYFESGGTVEPSSPAANLPTPAPPPLGREPRIGILHGTASNNRITKIQLAPLLKQLSFAEVHLIEGNCPVGDTPQAREMRKYFGDDQELKEYSPQSWDERGWRTYPRLETAIAHVETELAKLPGGGVDVLLGFSQGANLITSLVARAEVAARPFRCAALLSPGRPGWAAQIPDAFAARLRTPVVIVWSPSDQFICGPTTSGEAPQLATTGPHLCALLWEEEAVTRFPHSGPGHRPLPKETEERSALLQCIGDHVTRHCP